MSFEDEYSDVLQNLEFAIVQLDRGGVALLDYDVADALEALIRRYRSEQGGRTPSVPRLDGKPLKVYEAVEGICEMRLGRSEDQSLPEGVETLSLEELTECLKRIEKSVHRWNKQNGRRGYLDFVSKYIL